MVRDGNFRLRSIHAGILKWAGSTTGLETGSSDIWDTNLTANWWDGADLVNWPAPGGTDDDAVFGAAAGTVTVAPGGVIVPDISFNTTGHTLTGCNITVQNNGSLNLSNGRFIMGAGSSSAASDKVPTAVFTQTGGTTDIATNSTSLIGNITPGSLGIS